MGNAEPVERSGCRGGAGGRCGSRVPGCRGRDGGLVPGSSAVQGPCQPGPVPPRCLQGRGPRAGTVAPSPPPPATAPCGAPGCATTLGAQHLCCSGLVGEKGDLKTFLESN